MTHGGSPGAGGGRGPLQRGREARGAQHGARSTRGAARAGPGERLGVPLTGGPTRLGSRRAAAAPVQLFHARPAPEPRSGAGARSLRRSRPFRPPPQPCVRVVAPPHHLPPRWAPRTAQPRARPRRLLLPAAMTRASRWCGGAWLQAAWRALFRSLAAARPAARAERRVPPAQAECEKHTTHNDCWLILHGKARAAARRARGAPCHVSPVCARSSPPRLAHAAAAARRCITSRSTSTSTPAAVR